MKKVFSLIFVIIMILSSGVSAFADAPEAAAVSKEEIYSAKMKELEVGTMQELVDKLAEKPAAGNEWWILAIRNSFEDLDYSLYRKALEDFVVNTPPSNLTTMERIALTMVALESDSSYPEEIVDKAIDSDTLATYIFGLHLLNNGVKSKYSDMQVVDKLLAIQCPDGGWSLNGETGDPDLTAMAIQALAPCKDKRDIEGQLEKALDFLSLAQNEDGGYKSYGTLNPESSAQVLLALASLGIDAASDERFIKNGNTLFTSMESFQRGPGKYAHTETGDANQTTQTQMLYCYTGYTMFLEGGSRFYSFGPLSEKLIERTEAEAEKSINIKLILYIAIAAVMVILCAVKLIKGEKKAKAYASVVLICAVLAALVSFINIESTDEYYQKEEAENPIFTTISIYCKTVAGKADYIPADGIILEYKPIQVSSGASIYDQLVAACKEYNIQMESESGSYLNGIANIYERQFGDLSGWMFKHNGEYSDVGCNQKTLEDGDYVEWIFTVDLGKDIGNDYKGD